MTRWSGVSAAFLGIALLAGCGSSTATNTPGFPPKSKADLHSMANSSSTKLRVISHDQTSSPPTYVLYVVVPRGLSEGEQAAALMKAFYDHGLEAKAGNSPGGAALVLGYWKPSEVGNRYTAGKVELDVAKVPKLTLDVIGNSTRHEWKVRY